jgi:hypothetical protein
VNIHMPEFLIRRTTSPLTATVHFYFNTISSDKSPEQNFNFNSNTMSRNEALDQIRVDFPIPRTSVPSTHIVHITSIPTSRDHDPDELPPPPYASIVPPHYKGCPSSRSAVRTPQLL